MKKLMLKVSRDDYEYVESVEAFDRLKFLRYVKQDGKTGAEFFLKGEGCYDFEEPDETFTLFPGDKKRWTDWGTSITGPTEWDCYIKYVWNVELYEEE